MNSLDVTVTVFRLLWEALQFANVLDRAIEGSLPGDRAIRDAGFISHRGRPGKLRLVGSLYGVQNRQLGEWFETADREEAIFRLAAVWLGLEWDAANLLMSDG